MLTRRRLVNWGYAAADAALRTTRPDDAGGDRVAVPEGGRRVIDRATWLSWTDGLDDEAARNALVMLVALGIAVSLPDVRCPWSPPPRWRRSTTGSPTGPRPALTAHDARWLLRELLTILGSTR